MIIILNVCANNRQLIMADVDICLYCQECLRLFELLQLHVSLSIIIPTHKIPFRIYAQTRENQPCF